MRRRSERGQAAGVESIPFGILVFVGGLLLVVNAWAVVDTRAALDTAARDYLRAYTAAADVTSARAAGRDAAVSSLSARQRAHATRIDDPPEPFGACRPATVRLHLVVPLARVPFIGSFGSVTVEATETELVAPYGRARSSPDDAGPSPCDG